MVIVVSGAGQIILDILQGPELECESAQQVCLRAVVLKDHCVPVMNVQAIRCSDSKSDSL